MQVRKSLKENKGGPIHYFGSRFLSLPEATGHMKPNQDWLKAHFDVLSANHPGKYRRCIEPFSGSATWSLAAMGLGLADEYIINDSDAVLIQALRSIKEKPEMVILAYQKLVKNYREAEDKINFYKKVIDKYNGITDIERKSLMLPFVINHAWGGIIYHNEQGNLVFKSEPVFGAPVGSGILNEANLTPDEFAAEVEQVSHLLRKNKVTLKSGDFSAVLTDVTADDLVGLNPPYPENMRYHEEKVAMYHELTSPEILHESIKGAVEMLERVQADYYMTYGLYAPDNQAYLVLDSSGQRRNYFRVMGSEACAFGAALDQLYYPSRFTIPVEYQTSIIPANRVLGGQELSHDASMVSFQNESQEIANAMRGGIRAGM